MTTGAVSIEIPQEFVTNIDFKKELFWLKVMADFHKIFPR